MGFRSKEDSFFDPNVALRRRNNAVDRLTRVEGWRDRMLEEHHPIAGFVADLAVRFVEHDVDASLEHLDMATRVAAMVEGKVHQLDDESIVAER